MACSLAVVMLCELVGLVISASDLLLSLAYRSGVRHLFFQVMNFGNLSELGNFGSVRSIARRILWRPFCCLFLGRVEQIAEGGCHPKDYCSSRYYPAF
jgi:hypothetical protein